MIQPRGASVVAALLADALIGEPPEAAHPIVLMGRAISAFEELVLAFKGERRLRLAGLFLAAALPTLSFVLARLVLRLAPAKLRWLLEVGLLSTALSMRGLARSAVESIAENTSDGVVAPMVYGLLLGAPGALAYKAVNTLDSMVGHPQPPYKDLGWIPARMDDLANLLPARLTALSVAIVSNRGLATLASARRYGPLTRSPNAGRVEAAFAGALDLRLGGANSYGGVLRQGPVLGSGHTPEAADIPRAVSLMRRSCLLLAALFLAAQRVAGGRHSG